MRDVGEASGTEQARGAREQWVPENAGSPSSETGERGVSGDLPASSQLKMPLLDTGVHVWGILEHFRLCLHADQENLDQEG